MERRSLRVGIDVGGTFTDVVAVESWSGVTIVRKVGSTPKEPHRAVIRALAELRASYESAPSIVFVAHSTTIATNALLGQLGLELPRVALVTTEGFRDAIEIGRQNRSEVYNLFVERPAPLVAREDRLTVRERLDYRGEILVPLDRSSLLQLCEQLRGRPVSAVAICLLHSYANAAHERIVADAIGAACPSLKITLSSEIDPEYREYERWSTTVVNAVLAPIVETYLERLSAGLREEGVDSPLYVMRSDGGLSAAPQVLTRPAMIIESGPASGAIAAAALGRAIGVHRLISFDMGGTTAKAGAIVEGVAQVANEFEAAGRTHSGRALKGSGYSVRFPFVDLAEVSAGGGTIAWIDDGGGLRVGPISAGADPGPACYGKSQRPTATDANLVLGRLNPRALLGGGFPIDAGRARHAVATIADALEMGIEESAAGIVRLIDDAMAKVLRIVTVERGLDPRDFSLVAFGGGGPLHACALAEELGIERIVVPPHPGLFSASGLLEAPLTMSEVRAILRDASEVDIDPTERVFLEAEARARAMLLEQGAGETTIGFRREYDARYRGQSFELTIPYDSRPSVVAQHFHAAHRARYGYETPEAIVELVNARLTASARVATSIERARYSRVTLSPSTSLGINSVEGRLEKKTRKLWIGGTFVEAPVYTRDALVHDARIDGPAIVEGYDSTTYVAPGWQLTTERELMILEPR